MAAKTSRKPKRGPNIEAQSEYIEEMLKIDRVMRVVKGGRRLRFRATVAVGNQKGKIGIGVGKAQEVAAAIKKAASQAKKNMHTIKLAGSTIPHQTKTKFKSSKLILLPAKEGTGLIAGGVVRRILEIAGVQNILSKSHGSRNKVNLSFATLKALTGLREFEGMVTVKVEERKVIKKEKPQRKKTGRKGGKGRGAARDAAKPEKKPETKTAKSEAKAEEKPETKTAKSEVKADTKPETKPEVKAEAKPEVKAEEKASKPETKPEAKEE